MIFRRPADERGKADFGWLKTQHTFSFGSYHDPRYMGFGPLRVINEDHVAPGTGFDTHGHRDMEIITYVLSGRLAHRDSIGNGAVIRPGEVQRMTAGTGILHSEFNDSREEPVHLLQIWIEPERHGLQPGYEQKAFVIDGATLVASRHGRDGSVAINQDVDLYAAKLGTGKTLEHGLRPGRLAWVQVARGAIALNGMELAAGDGAAVKDETDLRLRAGASSEVLLFDMAA